MDILNKIEKLVKREKIIAEWYNLGGDNYRQGFVHGLDKCLMYLGDAKQIGYAGNPIKQIEQEQLEYVQHSLVEDKNYSIKNIMGSGDFQDGFLGGVSRAQYLVRQEVEGEYYSEASYYRKALVNISEYLKDSTADKAVQVNKIHAYVNSILED